MYVRAQKNAKLPMIPKREITYNKIIWYITDLVVFDTMSPEFGRCPRTFQ